MNRFVLMMLTVLCVVRIAEAARVEKPWPVGYALNLAQITDEKISYIKSLGISYIELAGIGALLDKNLQSTEVVPNWSKRMQDIATILDRHQVRVWSVHMPFSRHMDISRLDEPGRLRVLEAHQHVLDALTPVQPRFILFHPSYYLELNQREARVDQLLRSVRFLNQAVKDHEWEMVVENMLGPELTVNERERPLLRTVEECLAIFSRFPEEVGLAVDMCHIAEPEHLIRAFGSRVKTLHVSNGNGQAEHHYLPCDPRGTNDWNAIFSALQASGYRGVFMHECKFQDEQEIVDCYDALWKNYQTHLSINE